MPLCNEVIIHGFMCFPSHVSLLCSKLVGGRILTTIRATCPTCGENDYAPSEVALLVCSHSAASYYVFTCKICGETIRKHADDRVIELLLMGGVRATLWDLPDELLEPHPQTPMTQSEVDNIVIDLNTLDPDQIGDELDTITEDLRRKNLPPTP